MACWVTRLALLQAKGKVVMVELILAASVRVPAFALAAKDA